MKLLLTGAKGMLAADIQRQMPYGIELSATDVDELDITNFAAIDRFCSQCAPDAILNCAGYTAVDKAESDRTAAFAVNETGPANLARVCAVRGMPLIHISTDFVFNGDGSHLLAEDDTPEPRGVYAESKRAGELAIEHAGGSWLIVRTSWLFGLCGRNFPGTIMRLALERDTLTVVNDQTGSPTYTRDLAGAVWELIARRAAGYVHFCNQGVCTWFDFAREIVRQAQARELLPRDRTINILPVTSQHYRSPAPRPAYSAMSVARCAALIGRQPRRWQDALGDYLDECLKAAR